MKEIVLRGVLPRVFENDAARPSDIWRGEVAFRRGEFYIVEAASGTGKTSMCAFIYGLRRDYLGSICFDTANIKDMGIGEWQCLRRGSLSYVPQDLDLFEELSAYENVELKRRLTDDVDSRRVDEWFERLGIADRRDYLVGKMSIGQRQRVAIIRALCQPFDFLLLDEPVSHLDLANNRIAAEIVVEEARRRGGGVIATSVGNHLLFESCVHLSL